MLDRFHKYNTEKALFRKEDKVLVAVSGGVDSIVLVHLLKAYNAHFSIAHCNFGLRKEASDEDEAFVEQLAEDLNLNIHIKQFDTKAYAALKGISTQMAARDLRYEWFDKLLKEKDYKYLLTAHHKNDLLETVIFNLVRGTGIAGLHGIKAKSNNRVRPLLFATKEEILTYAIDNKIKWREDQSNQSTDYQRNLLRLEVIPKLKNINANIENTIEQTVDKISAAENVFNHYIEGCKIDFLTKEEGYYTLAYSFLKEEVEPRIVLFEILKPFGFNYIQSGNIFESLDKEAGGKFLSETHLLVKDRANLVITKRTESVLEDSVFISASDSSVHIPWLNKQIDIEPHIGFEKTNNTTIAYLNKAKIKYPLELRKWKSGDRFQPIGMFGKKLISDFLNDQKVPVNLKSEVPVLLSNNEIIWVIGHRINESFKALESKDSLCIKLH